jgi:hypothetical protein
MQAMSCGCSCSGMVRATLITSSTSTHEGFDISLT